jgi:hypothetical protein
LIDFVTLCYTTVLARVPGKSKKMPFCQVLGSTVVLVVLVDKCGTTGGMLGGTAGGQVGGVGGTSGGFGQWRGWVAWLTCTTAQVVLDNDGGTSGRLWTVAWLTCTTTQVVLDLVTQRGQCCVSTTRYITVRVQW